MSLLKLKSKIAKKPRKRRGRGDSAGQGSFSGRGCKGQKARTGGKIRAGFEGGQTPFLRRIPKFKGFRNTRRIEYQLINTGELNIFDNDTKITKETLYAKNLISKKDKPVKLLAGKEKLSKKLTITVDKASQKAQKIITANKGKMTLLSPAAKEPQPETAKVAQ